MNQKQTPQSVPAAEFEVTGDLSDHASHLFLPEYLAAYSAGLKKSQMSDSASRRSRFFHICQMLQLTRGIPGSTAEAGVFRGLSSYLICHYLRREISTFNGETHFMIDSFEGLSPPVEKDGEFSAKRHSEGAFTRTSLEHVRETLSDFSGVNILKGWIPDVFGRLPQQNYRFVHVDVDVYEPTLASFRYFFPRLSPGGIMMCDDFGPWAGNKWAGCIGAVNEFANEMGVVYAVLDTGNVMFIKR